MIAAVIVTYNRIELLQECIQSVLNQEGQKCDLLIVDNASTDGTAEYLEEISSKYSNICCFRLDHNTGGAGGFYYGIKKAVELGYDYIWVMDDDTIPDPDCLYQLMEADRITGGPGCYGFLSSASFWTDGSECKMNRQKINKKYFDKLEHLQDGLVLIDQATFVSLFLPKETVLRAGLPIKEYFIWGDDIEYTRRISVRMNMPSYLVGKSKVIHKMSNNEGSSIALDNVDRIERYNYAYRNDNSTYRKEGFRGFCYYTAKCGINTLRVIAKAKDHRIKRLGIIARNYFTGLAFNPKHEYIGGKSGNEQ